jgi:hypothetical protein
MRKATPPQLRPFPAAQQRRLDRLLDKNSAGTITPAEKKTLEQLVALAEACMVENSRRIAEFCQSQGEYPPAGAVPVTVWVQTEPQEPEQRGSSRSGASNG